MINRTIRSMDCLSLSEQPKVVCSCYYDTEKIGGNNGNPSVYAVTRRSILKKEMTKRTKTRKCAIRAKVLSTKDNRITENVKKREKEEKAKAEALVVRKEQIPSSMFFKYNTALGPPFRVLIDTNFINFSIQNKLDIVKSMMDCLLAKCIPYITDCVMAELEKFGSRYHLALCLAKDPRFQRLTCTHKGTYADDCIVERVRTVRPHTVPDF